jgi:hypothetical protein
VTSSNRPPRNRHDRGAATPLIVAVLATCTLVVAALGDIAVTQRRYAEATTAAEAIAVAATIGGNLEQLAATYRVDTFTVERDEHIVVVRVWRDGVAAQASTLDHRRTLVPVE